MTDSPLLLGIEGGGTRTTALLARDNTALFQGEFGTGNVRLLNDAQVLSLCREIRRAIREFSEPSAIAFGMAGARTEADRARVVRIALTVWKNAVVRATHDLEIALLAAPEPKQPVAASVLVLSGTGSCCVGRGADGRMEQVGGWGHILGDEGSGYDIGLLGLQQAVHAWDRHRHWGKLGRNLLASLQLNEPNDLIGWAQAAEKKTVAALSAVVFASAEDGDPLAKQVVAHAAESLAKDGLLCAARVAKPKDAVQFTLVGGVLLKQPKLAKTVTKAIQEARPNAIVTKLSRSGAWGAVAMAKEELTRKTDIPARPERAAKIPDPKRRMLSAGSPFAGQECPTYKLSPTELRHPRSMNLDTLSIEKSIELFLDEDAKIPGTLLKEKAKIARVIGWIVKSFRSGGRLFYVGAGTSGRLGILDASECPPTFRTPPELVQGIIAGGAPAVWRAVEGAEDDADGGAKAIRFRQVGKRDVVVGIAASGRTPFVWGALDEAKRRGAKTALLCFNPHVVAERRGQVDVIIAPDTGPELLTGSTRLKSGTATKLVLNLFTTLAMVRIGKVIGNLMVDVNPSNVKLRARAIRIVRELTGADDEAAKAALEKSGWVVREAWLKLKTKRKPPTSKVQRNSKS
jgi:N-acetylmuramic acid 6-phosphate etherase